MGPSVIFWNMRKDSPDGAVTQLPNVKAALIFTGDAAFSLIGSALIGSGLRIALIRRTKPDIFGRQNSLKWLFAYRKPSSKKFENFALEAKRWLELGFLGLKCSSKNYLTAQGRHYLIYINMIRHDTVVRPQSCGTLIGSDQRNALIRRTKPDIFGRQKQLKVAICLSKTSSKKFENFALEAKRWLELGFLGLKCDSKNYLTAQGRHYLIYINMIWWSDPSPVDDTVVLPQSS